MKALITGASGFVGGHLAKYLFSSGDEVLALDPSVDISDESALSQAMTAFASEHVDVIYHLAALAHVGDSFGSSVKVFGVNVIGTLNLLESSRKLFPEAKIIVVSSSEVYGRVDPRYLPVDEDAPLAPLSPYAASKAAAEHVALQAFRAYGQRVIIARPFNHIGPGQSDSYVVSAIARRVVMAKMNGSRSIVAGNLQSKRDFTDVRDVVDAYRKMAEFGVPGVVYNVCSGKAETIADLAEKIITLAGADVKFVSDPGLSRDVEVTNIAGDSTRCRSELNWSPQIPIETSLKDVLAWWSARLTAD